MSFKSIVATKHKVSENLIFEVVEDQIVPAQKIAEDLGESFSELIRPLSTKEFEQKLDKLKKVRPGNQPVQFFYKLLELRNLRSVPQVGLIVNSFDLRYTKEQVEAIIGIL